MSNFLSDLLWLPRPDCDFSVRCSHLSADTSELGRKIMNMSGYGLDLNQMQRLSRTIQKLKSDPSVSLSPLTPFRLAILGNGTLEFLPSACVATAARHGLDLDIMVGKYDQMLQDAIDARSEVNTFKPQAVLIAIDYRALPWTPTPGNAEAAAYNVKMALDYLQSIRKGILRHSGAICIMQTLAPPVESVCGHYDGR